ncbi:MAG: alanine--tRNA ligase [Candidatus Omnitrophota bacterium]
MKKLTTNQLRKAFLEFFVSKEHMRIKSDSLVPTNDPSVLFTSAGMNPFKDYFLGKRKDLKRATSCQKCLRTGDLDQVGQTPFHHTFFEMLGNFSFGDYFKSEAIAWAWEFMTAVLEIPSADLWISVYEDDQEACGIWNRQIGIPIERIKKMGPKENFWPANAIVDGPNGPCGPCSEIYYQKQNGAPVEVWNLVFTQFDRHDSGVLTPLPNKNIDTGMGLERMSAVLQGVDSNFKIDIFAPILESVKRCIERREERVIHTMADHARAVTFSIADGVMPSNDGRGYVVRKLIRRCAYLAQAEHPAPFFYKLVSSVADAMREEYPEILERRDNIAQIIKAEEEKYIRNILEGGSERLHAIVDELKIAGKKGLLSQTALDLYMTYGIQPDFTKEVCQQEGLQVNMDEISSLVIQEQLKSRRTRKSSGAIFSHGGVVLKETQFVGYEKDCVGSRLIQMIREGVQVEDLDDPQAVYGLVLDQTPFYGESGGQVGDRGFISLKNGQAKVEVIDTKKQGKSIVHFVKGVDGKGVFKIGCDVVAEVDTDHRQAVKRSHTATHVLQAALQKVLGKHVQQSGSFVEADRFRFDFTHFQDIKPEELQGIEALVNGMVMANDTLISQVMPKHEAQKTGALALFGEKYEDIVRVVSIANYSKEFCGGTHLDATGKIGLVLITSENSVGSGLRRIEALTGKLAYEKLREGQRILGDVADLLKVKPSGLMSAVVQQISSLKFLEKECLRLKESNLRYDMEVLAENTQKIKGISLVIYKFLDFDPGLLRRAVDFLKERVKNKGIFFLSSVQESNAAFVCGMTSDLVHLGMSADSLIKKVLKMVGGTGGGRPDFAQGGTKDISKVDTALKEMERLIKEEIAGV